MNNVEIQRIMHYESEGAYPDLSEHSDKLELHAVPEFDFDCRVEQSNTVEFKVLMLCLITPTRKFGKLTTVS